MHQLKRTLLIILPALLFIAACKKDQGPAPEEIIVPIVVGRDTTLTLQLSESSLEATSENAAIASATVQGNKIFISALQVGSADIKIRNSSSTVKVILKVEVNRGYSLLRLSEYKTIVVATDVAVKSMIEQDLINTQPLALNAMYGFNYFHEPSELFVFPQGLDGDKIVGTISFDADTRMINLNYNGKDFSYSAYNASSFKGITVSESPRIPFGFMEDLTLKYQQQYPEAGITQVLRAQILDDKIK